MNALIIQIERVLERQLFKDSANGMKVLVSAVINVLNAYKSTVHVKKRDVLAASRSAAEQASTEDSTVKPEINKNIDAQDEADLQNVFRLAAIGAKEGIAEGITKIVGRDITNPILQTTDNSDFNSVDQYQIHQLFTEITEGAERPESSNIRRQFVNIAGTIFDWREVIVTNVEQMAAMSEIYIGCGVRVHSDLRAVIILANTECAAQQTWGAEISVAHQKIIVRYKYNHVHNAESIREILRILATADAVRHRQKAMAPGELVDMVSQGITRLQQLVQKNPEPLP